MGAASTLSGCAYINTEEREKMAAPSYNRRTFLRRTGGAAAGLLAADLLGAYGSASAGQAASGLDQLAPAKSILWSTNEAYARSNMVKPFEDQSHIHVDLQYFSDVAEVTSKLRTGGSGISLYTDGSYNSRISYNMGILQPLDMKNIPNWNHVLPQFKNAQGMKFGGRQYGVPFIWGTDSIAYRADKVKGKIDDISALWDPQFKGKIAMPDDLNESPQVAAMYLGFDKPWDLTPAQLKEVKSALLKQKPLVRTYWHEIGDLKNLFATGEVLIAWSWVPVMELVHTANIDMAWAVPRQGQLTWWDGNFIPKSASPAQKLAAEKLINYTLGNLYGVTVAEGPGYRTTAKLAVDKMKPALRNKLNFNDVGHFLKGAVWFQPPTRPKAYEQMWTDVKNA